MNLLILEALAGLLDASIVHVGNTAQATIQPASGSYTFTGASIGTARADRYLILVVTTKGDSPTGTITINGVATASEVRTLSLTGSGFMRVVIAPVPTGTTANIVVNVNSSGSGMSQCVLGVYAAYDLQSATPIDNLTVSSNSQMAPAVVPGCVLIGGAIIGTATTFTAVGPDLVEDADASIPDSFSYTQGHANIPAIVTEQNFRFNAASAGTYRGFVAVFR